MIKSIKKFKINKNIPLGEQIYLQLKEKIISTELYPLTEIYEGKLAIALNVSRTPIRDALKKLEIENLIQTIPQVKSIVAPIDVNSIKETNEIRKTLEIKIIENLIKKIDPIKVKTIKEINNKFTNSLINKNFNQSFYYDNLFHETLAKFADMKLAWKIISQINNQINRIRHLSFTHEGLWHYGFDLLIKDHKEIIKYISRKDIKNSKKIMHKHISSVERYVSFIKQQKKFKKIIK